MIEGDNGQRSEIVTNIDKLMKGIFYNDKQGDFSRFQDRPITLQEWETAVGRLGLSIKYHQFFPVKKVPPKDISMPKFLYDAEAQTSFFIYFLEHKLHMEVLVQHPALAVCLLQRFGEYRKRISGDELYIYTPSPEEIMEFVLGSEYIADYFNKWEKDTICPTYRRNFLNSGPQMAKAVWDALSSYTYQWPLSPEHFSEDGFLSGSMAEHLRASGALKEHHATEQKKENPAEQQDP